MAIPNPDSIDWSSIDSLSDLHRAMFEALVNDRNDSLLIVTSNTTVFVVDEMSDAPDAMCLGVSRMMQESLGEQAIVTSSWVCRDPKSVLAGTHVMWVGTHPSTVHALT